MPEQEIDAAMVGKMFVTGVSFRWHSKQTTWRDNKNVEIPAHWEISATLADKPSYGERQTMTFDVEHGIGQKLAEILLPIVIADASRKAQQLADDSKAMLAALGERAIQCIADMPAESK